MRQCRTVLVFLVTAGSLLAARPAAATVWLNYATRTFSSSNRLYLSIPQSATKGQAATLQTFTGLSGETFVLTPFGTDPNFSRLVSPIHADPQPGPQMVLGVSANNMNNGTAIIDWTPTTDLNQQWRAEFKTGDGNGANCYVLHNDNSPSGRDVVMGVGGTIVSGRAVIIWDNFSDPTNHPDQLWCRYTYNNMGVLVPE